VLGHRQANKESPEGPWVNAGRARTACKHEFKRTCPTGAGWKNRPTLLDFEQTRYGVGYVGCPVSGGRAPFSRGPVDPGVSEAPASSTLLDEDEERHQREEAAREGEAATWAEDLANALEKFEADLRKLNQQPTSGEDYWIRQVASQLYARYFALLPFFEELESRRSLSVSSLEVRNRLDTAWKRMHPLLLQYLDSGKVPDRPQAVSGRGVEEQRDQRDTTSEQAESAG
jgi:hypothetical protein